MEIYRKLYEIKDDLEAFKRLIRDPKVAYDCLILFTRLRWFDQSPLDKLAYTYMDVSTGSLSDFSIYENDYDFFKKVNTIDKTRRLICIINNSDGGRQAIVYSLKSDTDFLDESYDRTQYNCQTKGVPTHEEFIDAFNLNCKRMPSIETIKQNTSREIIYRPHQILAMNSTKNLIMKNSSKSCNIIWGHIPRSGKSYMMSGLIEMLDGLIENGNYLIITTAPNETIGQYRKILIMHTLRGFKIIHSKKQLDHMGDKNIIILSKQMMTHVSNINLIIDNVKLIIIDEAHYGGVTKKAITMLDKYLDIPKIFVTATYAKVLKNINIDETMTWTLEDIAFAKNRNIDILEKRHSGFKDAVKTWHEQYGDNCDALFCYDSFPTMTIIERPIDIKAMLSVDDFGDLVEPDRMAEVIDDIINVTIPLIDEHNKRINQRTILNKLDPSVIMIFVPWDKIRDTTERLTELINTMSNNFIVCQCNTVVDEPIRVRKNIDMGLCKAKCSGKLAVIAISGAQGHLGVTIDNCDLVVMLNTIASKDFITQATFRCMTEASNKSNGYVIAIDYTKIVQAIGYPCDQLVLS